MRHGVKMKLLILVLLLGLTSTYAPRAEAQSSSSYPKTIYAFCVTQDPVRYTNIFTLTLNAEAEFNDLYNGVRQEFIKANGFGDCVAISDRARVEETLAASKDNYRQRQISYGSMSWVSARATAANTSSTPSSPTSVRVSGYGHMPERVAKGCAVSQPAETGRIKIKNICGYEILVASCPLGTGPSHCHVGREDWAVYLTHIAPGASESMVASDGRQQTPIMACKGPASSVRVTIMGMGKGQCLGHRK